LGYFYWDIIYSTGKPMGFYEFGTWLSIRGGCRSCMQFLGCDVACWPNGVYNMNPQRNNWYSPQREDLPKGPRPIIPCNSRPNLVLAMRCPPYLAELVYHGFN
jgi:hypothetical protein